MQCLSYMSRCKVLLFAPMLHCVDCYIFAAYQDVLGHFLGRDSFLILTVPTLFLFFFSFLSLWTKPSNFSVSMSDQVTIRWGLLSRVQFPFSLTLDVVSRQSCYCTFSLLKRSSSLCTSAPSPLLPSKKQAKEVKDPRSISSPFAATCYTLMAINFHFKLLLMVVILWYISFVTLILFLWTYEHIWTYFSCLGASRLTMWFYERR